MWSERRRALGCAVGMVVTLLVSGCAGSTPDSADGEITLAGQKDTSGHLRELIDVWNGLHPDKKVRFIELPERAGQQRQQLLQNFLAHSSVYDAVIIDDTSITELATKNWITPLPADQFPLGEYFPATVEAGMVNGKLYAAPYYASTELFLYRRDLVPEPPKTWAELEADCAIARANRIGCYSGQFAQYEGLTVNVANAVRSAGGDILSADGKHAAVNTPEAKRGLEFLVNGFRQGNIPKEAITYQEEESRRAFQQGSLLFLTNYSYVYTKANQPTPDTNVAGKVGVTVPPGPNGPGVATTGGHMMAVSAFSRHRVDATEFVKYFTGEPNERELLIKQSYAPVWKKLYDDPALIRQFPFLPALKDTLSRGRARPKTVNYAALTLAVQTNAYAALQGRVGVDAALATMSDRINAALSDDR